jgi:hypothetical protein
MLGARTEFNTNVHSQQVKREVVWTPNQGNESRVGGHTGTGFKKQTAKKLNLGAPPAPRSLSDLP